MAAAYNFPCEEPKRAATHWDYVLREAQWLAEDMMQVRRTNSRDAGVAWSAMPGSHA